MVKYFQLGNTETSLFSVAFSLELNTNAEFPIVQQWMIFPNVLSQAKRISRSLSDILQESDEEEDENQDGESDVEMGSENGDVPMPDAMTRWDYEVMALWIDSWIKYASITSLSVMVAKL